MLEQDAIIFLMNTDGILDLTDLTALGRKTGVQIVDSTFAITPK